MSLPFYLTFVAASCIFTVGINGQIGPSNSPPPPQNLLFSSCPYTPTINCPSTTDFRCIDGSCNVANSPYLGKSQTPYIRIVSAMYINNTIPRTTNFYGQSLPWPRKISNDFFKATSVPSTKLSVITPTFARFVEHDLYKTKLMDASSCCTPTQGAGVCDNIKVTTTDPYFGKYFRTCLPKGNAVATTKVDCKSGGPTQQINENTHPLDLSNIYGSTKAASDRLRTKTDGLLKVAAKNNLLPKYLLPECLLPSPNPNDVHCFDAGDLRVNIDPLIMTMYTIWVRHHNAIAKELKHILKDANDETIFQTARKIVIAQYQHIVYNELLPVFDNTTPLKPTPMGTSSHKVEANPTIFNSFSLVYTAIVDSMVPQQIKIDASTVPLDSVYYKPAKVFETDGIKKMLEAMQIAKAEEVDRYMVKALKDSYLQKAPGSGLDKVALNLQQSRENGAPLYTVIYHVLNKKYGGILSEIDLSIKELRALYPMEHDIELLPGLFSEKGVTGAAYGKTTQILMEKQFTALKEGDRFFYSHAGVFTTEQFKDIKKTTLAKILCTHGHLDKVLPNALNLEVLSTNSKRSCNTIADINICLWATADWSDWKNLGCYGGVLVYTRKCTILIGSPCTCIGNPIKYESCPMGQFQNIAIPGALNKINNTFYENFGADGNPLDPNNTLNVIELLTGVTP